MNKVATTQWSKYQKRVRTVIEHIHENPGAALTSDALAEVAHLSPYHWHRIYKSITGESAAATVKRCRMHTAAATLLRTDKPVVEVGASVGFPDVHSFTRTFKSHYGVAPGQFRSARAEVVEDVVDDTGIENLAYEKVKIVESPERRLVGLWHYGDFMTIGVTFEKVMAQCAMAGLMSEQTQTIGVYFSDPDCVPEKHLRSFAGVVVARDVNTPDTLENYNTCAGNFAVLTHQGPYALLAQGYHWLYSNWLPASNKMVRDEPCCEVYLNNPVDTAQQELLTDICMPIE